MSTKYTAAQLAALNANRLSLLPPMEGQSLPEGCFGVGKGYSPEGAYVYRVQGFALTDETFEAELTHKGEVLGTANLPTEIGGWLLSGSVRPVRDRATGETRPQFVRDGRKAGKFRLTRDLTDRNATYSGQVWYGDAEPVNAFAWANAMTVAATGEVSWAINFSPVSTSLPDAPPEF